MTHTHLEEEPELSSAELARRRRALRIMVVVLIPLGIWTLAGLIALWPKDVDSHVNPEIGFSVPGVTFPTGRIIHIDETSCAGLPGSTEDSKQVCANIEVKLLEGDEVGQSVTVPLTAELFGSGTRVGQTVKLVRIPPAEGQPAQYQFSDFERRIPLLVVTLVFAAAVILVARWRGFASILGLGFAFFILVEFMFPALVLGTNPIMVGLIGSAAIMFVVMYAAHGFNARTTTALVGTLFGLILIAAMGWFATRWAHLTGVSSEDDYVLSAAAPDLQLTSVVMCGIIVAGLGVLNDVTITQASAVWELASTDSDQRRLFSRAMRIGRDHIASTVYTIAFVTVGAAMPILLLIAIYDRPMFEVIQTEQFAGEIVRTLVGSIGLILAMPLTTAVAVAVVRVSARPALAGGVGARGSTEATSPGRLGALLARVPLGPLHGKSAASERGQPGGSGRATSSSTAAGTADELAEADLADLTTSAGDSSDLPAAGLAGSEAEGSEPDEGGDGEGEAARGGAGEGGTAPPGEGGADEGEAAWASSASPGPVPPRSEPRGAATPRSESPDPVSPSSGADAPATASVPKARRWRRRVEDDFGDFSDLRDPDAPPSSPRPD